MSVSRPLRTASTRLFSSSTRCEHTRQKATNHVLRDYNVTATFRYSLLDEAPPEVQAFPLVTTADLQRLKIPPRRVKMVTREYVSVAGLN